MNEEPVLSQMVKIEMTRELQTEADMYASNIILSFLLLELFIEEQYWKRFLNYCHTGRFND